MIGVWRDVSLGDATISLDFRRKPVKEAERRPGPYPYWGASGVVDYVDDYLFDHPSLLLSEDGENLKTRKTPIVFYVDGKYWVNNHAHVYVAAEGYDLRFLAYQLQGASISGYLTGSTQPKLTAGNAARIPIRAPELSEQRRIASVLGAFDDLIDTNRRLASRAQSLAVALLEGVEEVTALSEVAVPVKVPLFRPVGTVEHYSLPAFDAGGRPETVDGGEIKSGKQRLIAPSVLVSRLNPKTPRVWMSYPAGEAAASTEFVVLAGKDDVAVEEIWAACSSQTFTSEMRSRVTGTTGSHQRVDKAAIPTIGVPDPRSLGIPRRRAVVPLVQEADDSLAQAAELAKIRDELLPLLMSGRVTVDEAWEAAS